MKSEKLLEFKDLFETERSRILQSHSISLQEFDVKEEDLSDEVDLTSAEQETSMRMRLRSRELLYLKKVEQALIRIVNGNFGECDSCGEEIDFKRLEARPTTDVCVACKEEQEFKEKTHVDGRKPKSLGRHLVRVS